MSQRVEIYVRDTTTEQTTDPVWKIEPLFDEGIIKVVCLDAFDISMSIERMDY